MSRRSLERIGILDRLRGELDWAPKRSDGSLYPGAYESVIEKVRRSLNLNRYDKGLLENLYGPEALEQHRATRRYRQEGELNPDRYPQGQRSGTDDQDSYEYQVRIRPTDGNSDGESGDTLHTQRSREPLSQDQLEELIRELIAEGELSKGSQGEGDILEDHEHIEVEVLRIHRIPGRRQ